MNQPFDSRLDALGNARMTVNGLACTLNLPPALKSKHGADGEEQDWGLPPYGQRPAFNVDEFDKACPVSWMRGDAKSSSYFVPVKSEHGLWLDFNGNLGHTHHLAVRVSMQGVCAITALVTKDRMRLEQYREKCPKHDLVFGAERFCKDCNFKWPAQNYLASTGTPNGLFWLDGFRAKDGRVRQFVFTEETARGVAAQVIGEDRVFAIGIAFFLSKEPKPLPLPGSHYRGGHHVGYGHAESIFCLDGGLFAGDTLSYNAGPVVKGQLESPTTMHGPAVRRTRGSAAVRAFAPVKRLEVAAGARIQQEVYPDPQDLAFWQDEPAGVLYVNYCDEETARAILSQGREDRTARGEGPLAALRVGHPSSGDQ